MNLPFFLNRRPRLSALSMFAAALRCLFCLALSGLFIVRQTRGQSATSQFHFDQAAYTVSETNGSVVLKVIREGDRSQTVTLHFKAVPNEATAWGDFSAESGSITFDPGVASQPIAIWITDDFRHEPDESFLVNLYQGANLLTTAKVTIQDDDPFGIRFTINQMQISENFSFSPWIYIEADFEGNTPVTVHLKTEEGTAKPGQDYAPIDMLLTFSPGSSGTNVPLTILNDGLIESTESFSLALTGPNVLPQNTMEVLIEDNDHGFVFLPGTGNNEGFSTSEASGDAVTTVHFHSQTGFTNTVSVSYRTEDGSARAGEDYVATTGKLIFAPGETRKEVHIPILNDALTEGAESFYIRLFDGEGLPIGDERIAFTLKDNERGYGISTLELTETNGPVAVPILRIGDYNYASSVDYVIDQFTPERARAIPGVNFVPTSGTVTFAPGETNKSVVLNLLRDGRLDPGRNFFVRLSHPTAGVPIFVAEREIVLHEADLNPARIDPGFKPDLGLDLALQRQFAQPIPMPDGRILLRKQLLPGWGNVEVTRLLHDGTVDPSFQTVRGLQFNVYAFQGDQIVTSSGFLSDENGRSDRVVRLRADGAPDTSFHSGDLGIFGSIIQIAIDSRGRIVLATSGPGGYEVLRLTREGDVDATFAPPKIDGWVQSVAVDSLDRVLLAGGFFTLNNVPRGPLARLLPNGDVDLTLAMEDGDDYFLPFVRALDGSIFLPRSDGTSMTLQRFSPGGELVSSYRPTLAADSLLVPQPDGSLITLRWDGLGVIRRLRPDGTLDESFLAESIVFDSGSLPAVPEPDGNLLFSTQGFINGQPRRGLARVQLNAPAVRIELSPDSGQVFETNAAVSLNLTRAGDHSQPLTVEWRTGGGTAFSGVDYEPSNGLLSFGAGEWEKKIELVLRPQPGLNPDKTLHLQFKTSGGVELLPAELTIANADLGFEPGNVSFTNAGFIMGVTGASGGGLQLQWSANLKDWESFYDAPVGRAVADWEATAPARFYRLVRLL